MKSYDITSRLFVPCPSGFSDAVHVSAVQEDARFMDPASQMSHLRDCTPEQIFCPWPTPARTRCSTLNIFAVVVLPLLW